LPRGGRRSGSPGATYTNRSDLNAQPVRTAPGQPYGQAVAQQRAQQAIPLPATPPVQASPAPAVPPDPGMLHAPSARPGEPVTAGLPVGAGPGPEALGTIPQNDQILSNLYAAYRANPTEGLRALIEQTERMRAPAH
jgi:hypothetical protein